MAQKNEKSVFEVLNAINVNEHTEKKNGLTYLSWAWAWAEVKKAYPNANYKIYEAPNGNFYFTDGKTCWVKTGVTIEGQELIEYLPVMDYNRRSLTIDRITSFDVSIAAGKDDKLANEIFHFTGKMLGEACADFAAFSSPEAFIFFGGLVKAGDLIMSPIRDAYDSHVMPVFKGKAKFLISGLDGASAAVLGASALGWEL